MMFASGREIPDDLGAHLHHFHRHEHFHHEGSDVNHRSASSGVDAHHGPAYNIKSNRDYVEATFVFPNKNGSVLSPGEQNHNYDLAAFFQQQQQQQIHRPLQDHPQHPEQPHAVVVEVERGLRDGQKEGFGLTEHQKQNYHHVNDGAIVKRKAEEEEEEAGSKPVV